jgi:hypothetical protein
MRVDDIIHYRSHLSYSLVYDVEFPMPLLRANWIIHENDDIKMSMKIALNNE